MKSQVSMPIVMTFLLFIFQTASFSQSGWIELNSRTTARLSAVTFINADTGWVIGNNGKIMKTIDGGATWQNQNSRTANQLNSVYFINSQKGWIVGTSGTYRFTIDGGSTWTARSFSNADLRDVYFINENIGWICNWSSVFKTTDGGNSWYSPDSTSHQFAGKIQFYDENLGWMASNGIGKTTDGGTNWSQYNDDMNCHSFFFVNETHGWAVGSTEPLRTTDGGETWTTFELPQPIRLHDVFFINTQTGWVTGDNGTIHKTTDGGQNWQLQETTTNEMLVSVCFADSCTGWVVGWNGVILKTVTGGVTSVEQKSTNNFLPKDIGLSQNYPNPFNPSTTIQFSLNKSEQVSLKIFNLTGQHVVTLVDEVRSAGEYQVKWLADGLPGGIYLARLQAGKYSQIRKLILQQ